MKNSYKGIVLTLFISLTLLFSIVAFNYDSIKSYIRAQGQNSNIDQDITETASDNITIEPKSPSQYINNTPLPEATKNPVSTIKPVDVTETKSMEVNLSFVGDILLSNGVLANYDQKGIKGILSNGVLETLQAADITVANQEFPFSKRGSQAPDKQFTFRINPNRVSIFNELGIDIVTLANNHTLDFGEDALLDTLDTLDAAEITYMGAGKNLDRAKEIQYKKLNGINIAFLAASRVIPVPEWNATDSKPGLLTTYDPTNLIAQIKEAKSNADFTIVYLHWGIERKEWPEDYQRNLAKLYIDAGADLVVGSHPHCLQGIEYYKEKPIIYSLGNFIFGSTINKTIVLNTTITKEGKCAISILPCTASNFKTVEITDRKLVKQFYEYVESISYNISINEDGTVTSIN